MKFTKERQKAGNELFQKLIAKSWESSEFKEQLVTDPETAIEKVIGKNMIIPEGSKIIVEDQTDNNTIYLNIPRKIEVDELELTDEQLEGVSGGDFFTGAAVAIGIAVGLAQIADWVGEGYNMVK